MENTQEFKRVKKFEGYLYGQLCYEWEIKRDSKGTYHFMLNGCTQDKDSEIGYVVRQMLSNINDLLEHEEPKNIEIRGC